MIATMIANQRTFFATNTTKSYTFRKEQLEKLKRMLTDYETEIYEALKLDLNKSSHETLLTELSILHTEINLTLKNLKKWMMKKHVTTPLTHQGASSYIHKEPYGVVLNIAPWNYPLQLALAPVIGAIAAGNTVIIKPSEFAIQTSRLLKKMIASTFPENYLAVIEGDREVSEALLKERFDYIFFTGSTQVGKIVMKHASEYLTPVTLELGGKSPTIVDQDANIALASKRIAWGKFTNAGQTCVAPDYIYVHEKVYYKFIKQLKKQIVKLYDKEPLKNKDYVRIIHHRHFNRLVSMIDQQKIVHGGRYDESSLQIEPTVLAHVTWEDPVMQEEIFGPILPIIPFNDMTEVIQTIKTREKPLALYYFGSSTEMEEAIVSEISFGGGCINDTLFHLANPHLPFGGVGSSGMGAYHGRYSFDTFSHQKSILKQTTRFDLPFRYAKNKLSKSLLNKFLK